MNIFAAIITFGALCAGLAYVANWLRGPEPPHGRECDCDACEWDQDEGNRL